MSITITPMSASDGKAVIDIFNYYVENTFAAYPEEKVPYEFFDTFLKMSRGLPTGVLKDDTGEVIGFGLLRPYSPIPAFSAAAEITYFLRQDHTGRGLGAALLDYLTAEGRKQGIKNILASVSSLNVGSIKFHLKQGLGECTRFRGIGSNWGREFDVVYYQKNLLGGF